LLPTLIVVLVESTVPIGLAQALSVQTWKVTLPVSWVSGSLKVAVSAGVVECRRAALAGETSAGVEGAWSVVLFVIEALFSAAVAAGLPVGAAASRTIGFEPGLV
jgi:hypothetical protein